MELVTKKPRGTEDKLPKEIYKWHTVEKIARNVAEAYGCKEIRTPTFEHTELFQRGVGGTTDVVQKEMYTFNDKKGRSITLKPEGTAGAVRAVMEAVGIKNICAKCLRSNNPNNVVAATFQGLKSMRGPEDVAHIRGKSVEEIVG